MKKKDFFEQLNRELENALPPMSERLKDEIIQTSADRLPARCDTRTTTSKRKPSLRFVKIFTAAASIILSFIMLFSLFGRNIFLRGEEFAVMQIDINPSLALTLDEDYRVKKVTSRNEDGDVLLQDKTFAESLQDKSAEEAARLIAERAAATGYIRISDKGTAEKYNKITVSLFNNRENASKEAQGIQNELVEFFNDKGVYVYIETFSEKTPEAKTLTNKYDTLPTLWYDFKTESADIAALTSLAEKTVYDYAADLLKDALAKYDLLNEIGRINKKIIALPENSGGEIFGNYWTVDEKILGIEGNALFAQMSPLIETLYILYGIDCRERGLIHGSVSYQKYKAASDYYEAILDEEDMEDLRKLDAEGIDENSFGGIENLPRRLRFYSLVANDFFGKIASDILDGAVQTAEKLLNDISALVSDRAEKREQKFSALFSLERKPISEQEYEDFLQRIGKKE